MTKSPWRDPPLTGTPLDYVPIDAPITTIAPTRWSSPNPIKRGLNAAAWFGGVLGFMAIVLWTSFTR